MGPIGSGKGYLPDSWEVEILEDGRVKITTGPTSPAVHTTAEKMMAEINRLMGGEVKRAARPGHHGHHHHGQGHHHSH